MRPRLQRAAALLRTTFQEWDRDDVMMRAAAVSFYATFSIAPLLVLLLNGGAHLFGEAAARERLLELIGGAAGWRAAGAVERMIVSASETDAGTTIVSVILLLLSSSAVFQHLKLALNVVFDVPTREGFGMLAFIRTHILAAVIAAIGIVVLLTAVAATAAVAWFRVNVPEVIENATLLWRVAGFVVSFAILTTVFGATLKFVPDVKLAWRHAGIGAASASSLFVAGQFLISEYIARARVTLAYGAAGSAILLLLYVYFTVNVILLAAELTQVIARDDAMFRAERRRLQQDEEYEARKE